MAQEHLNDLDWSNLKFDGWRQAEKTITFDGGTANAIGDHDGSNDPFDIFTVTGDVIVKVVGICTTNLTSGTGTIEVGTSSDTAAIIAQATASDIDAGEIWHDASPDATVEASSVMTENVVANGADIVGTVGTDNITAGVIRFVCLWKALSKDGEVKAA